MPPMPAGLERRKPIGISEMVVDPHGKSPEKFAEIYRRRFCEIRQGPASKMECQHRRHSFETASLWRFWEDQPHRGAPLPILLEASAARGASLRGGLHCLTGWRMAPDETLTSAPDLTDMTAQGPSQPAAEPPRRLARIKNWKPHRNPASRKAKTGKPFVQLFHCWWSSPVIRSLSSVERDAMITIMMRYNGHNNGNLPVSVRWLSRELGVGKSTALRALDHLRAAGLIERVVAGRFQGRLSRATRWRVTCFACDVSGKQPVDWTHLPALTPVSLCDTLMANNL
jgi:hypothetical protein